MTNIAPRLLSDAALLIETVRVADAERRSTSQLLALLGGLDTRRLYLGLGYPSLFIYCMQALHLSEPAAYSRITAARAARRFPVILSRLADGDVNLTTVTLLAAHLTDENADSLLEAARHKSKREIERLVASLDPQPDVPSSLRRAPQYVEVVSPKPVTVSDQPEPIERTSLLAATPATRPAPTPTPSRAVVAPLAADRYLLKITLNPAARENLDRARDLLRHQIPAGDPAAIVDRALAVLVEQLERTKLGATRRPRRGASTRSTSRHVPTAVRHEVWARDDGRCAFVGVSGRCPETGFLEFHHVVPFALGGATDAGNLELRCRAYNVHEAERHFGTESDRTGRTLSGQSSGWDAGP